MPDVAELIARHAPWAALDRSWRLTPFEQFMWLDDRPDYPLVFEVLLQFGGEIDPDAMAGAWRFALARHPLLRATVVGGPDGPVWHAPAEGWRGLDVSEAGAPPPVDAEAVRGIDLAREPGLRGTLRETDDGWNLALRFHHACCDGHGARMFLQDLVLAYVVLREACDDEDPFFRVDAALLDERGIHRGSVGKGVSRLKRLRHVLRFALKRPAPVAGDVPRAGRRASRAAPEGGSVLGHRTHTFAAGDVAGMDAIQQRFAATRNDIAIAMLFEVLAGWQRQRGVSPRTRMRVAVPTDLRSRADERMPAANRYTYVFLERRLGDCREWQSLLPGLRRDFQERKQEGRGTQFLDALRRVAPFPKAMHWCLRRRACFSTAVLTNLSDPSWRLRKRLPVDAEGLMWLDKARCLDIQIRTPPLRPGTHWGIGIFEYAGRMTLSFRYDTTVVSEAAADGIMERYVGLWRTLLATADRGGGSVVEPTASCSRTL